MDIIATLEAQHRAIAATMLRLLNLSEGFCGPGQAYVIAVELTRLAHLLGPPRDRGRSILSGHDAIDE